MAGNRKDFLKGRNYRKPLREINDDNEEETRTAFGSVVIKKKLPPPPNNKLLHFATPGWFTQQVEKTLFQFDSSKQIQVHNDSRATATLETETEIPRSRIHKRADEDTKGKKDSKGKQKSSTNDDHRLYKGICAYKDHKTGFHGPLRAPAHIRTSSRFDYQPDVCKDYKETGYCGYGDSCKFLHDRGDYKSGWQLEKEWNQSEKDRKRKLAVRDEDDHDHDHDDVVRDDGLPFACFICRGPFVNPVVTKCKHYFCEKCALKHHGKKKSCYVCNRPTFGIFDTAHEIRKKMMKIGKK